MGCCAVITNPTDIIGPVVTGMVVILWKESVRIHFVVDMLTVANMYRMDRTRFVRIIPRAVILSAQ